jgi:multisubunit Na+/H+ antiporter MnhG subunit
LIEIPGFYCRKQQSTKKKTSIVIVVALATVVTVTIVHNFLIPNKVRVIFLKWEPQWVEK